MAPLSRLFRSSAVVAALALITGCVADHSPDGTHNPVAPTESSQARLQNETDLRYPVVTDLRRVARYNVRPSVSDYWIKHWIGPEGGTVNYMGFRIVVPPGAVDRRVMFTIRVPGEQDDSKEYALAEFGPHNYAFRKPVRIELPYAGTSAEGLTSGVLWYNERAKAWTEMPNDGITEDGRRVFLWTDHFSSYGTSSGGTPTVSGG